MLITNDSPMDRETERFLNFSLVLADEIVLPRNHVYVLLDCFLIE